LSQIDSITAILPIKLGSERVPDKNYGILGGKRLYEYILSTLLECPLVNNVVVSTNDMRISSELKHLEDVRILDRPSNLAKRDSSMNLVIDDVLGKVSGRFFVQVHATSPFLSSQTLGKGIRTFLSGDPLSSCFSATEIHGRLWSTDGKALNHDPLNLVPTQDLTPVLLENSAFYIFSREGFSKGGNRLHGFARPVIIPEIEAWDIDYPWQWEIAESIALQRRKD
jgi:CMP-N-acetylneuraminic acid synthetase